MRQRTHLIVLPLAVVLVSAAILALVTGFVTRRSGDHLALTHNDQVIMTGTVTPSYPYRVVFERVHVPIYEGANITYEGETEKYEYETIYFTPASIWKVISFYKSALPQFGSSGLEEHPYAANNLTATWIDPSQKLPWRVDLTLSAISAQTPTEGTMPPTQTPGANTRVSLVLYLYPDPSIIPIYYDAQKVGVTSRQEGLDEKNHTTVTTTTYVSSASAQEIFSFYESVLDEAGWEPDPGQDQLPTSIPALVSYNATAQVVTSKARFLYMHLTIGVQPAESGILNLELTVRATLIKEEL